MPNSEMTPERWQRVTEILDRALAIHDLDARKKFITKASQGDRIVQREVESLVKHAPTQTERLETPSFNADSVSTEPAGASPSSKPLIGQRIGPYKILDVVAEGGMGVVFRAEREDAFQQTVALKLIKPNAASEETMRRFHTERQILADLEDPHIARILDGGTTWDGLPYFTMEYVDGVPIDKYCDRRNLTIHERLKLFRTVCAAVSVAHQNLIIHRDLKPGNILVTADGTAKLLDFGIAKLLSIEEPLAEDQRARRLTPKYASPEQFRGEALTTATDIYSLGVMLFEVLTGEYPYPLPSSASPVEFEQIICEHEPPKPSLAARRLPGGKARRRERQLAGDLDSIVLKALRKDPKHRYSSVEKLSHDLHRYLENLPVLAHQDSWVYRAVKFVRRNRLKLTVFAVLLALGAGFGLATVNQLESARQRNQAIQELERSKKKRDFLASLFDETVTTREHLERAKEKLIRELGDDLEARAELAAIMGRVFRKQGYFDGAKQLIEESLRSRREFFGSEHPMVAESLHDLAHVVWKLGDTAKAVQLTKEAVDIQDEYSRESPNELTTGINNLATFHYQLGEYKKAEEEFRQVVERKRVLGVSEIELLLYRHNLAAALTGQGEYAEAEEIYREGLELRRRLYGPLHLKVARSLNSLGALLHEKGDLDKAEERLREALEIRRELLGVEHPEVAKSHYALGFVLHDKGASRAAVDEYQKALGIQHEKLEETHPDIAITKTKLADSLVTLGNFMAAEEHVVEALVALHKAAPRDSWRIAEAQSVLGGCRTAQGRYEEARHLLLGSYSQLVEARGNRAPPTRAARQRLVKLYEAWGWLEEAARYR